MERRNKWRFCSTARNKKFRLKKATEISLKWFFVIFTLSTQQNIYESKEWFRCLYKS